MITKKKGRCLMEIKAEMAGNSWKLLVAEGETVTSG